MAPDASQPAGLLGLFAVRQTLIDGENKLIEEHLLGAYAARYDAEFKAVGKALSSLYSVIPTNKMPQWKGIAEVLSVSEKILADNKLPVLLPSGERGYHDLGDTPIDGLGKALGALRKVVKRCSSLDEVLKDAARFLVEEKMAEPTVPFIKSSEVLRFALDTRAALVKELAETKAMLVANLGTYRDVGHLDKWFKLALGAGFSKQDTKDFFAEVNDGHIKVTTDMLTNLLYLAFLFESEEKNYNSKQNELKVGCNSTFGFFSAGGPCDYDEKTGKVRHKGMMQVMPVSACVTYIGRRSIMKARQHVEDNYGAKVIYGDTDSIFIVFPPQWIPPGKEGLYKSFELGPKVMAEITAIFAAHSPKSTMRIEHEKTASKMVVWHAKCYGYIKYEKLAEAKKAQGKVDIKGVPFMKRDCCKFVKTLCTESVNLLLKAETIEEGLKSSETFMKKEFTKLVIDEVVPDEHLVIKKKINKSDFKGAPAHAQLARRMNQRKPGMAAKSGEYQGMLYVDVNDPDGKKDMIDKIEDPSWVKEHPKQFKVDKLWYLKNQIANNVKLLFGPIIKDPIREYVEPFINLQFKAQIGFGRDMDVMDMDDAFE